MTEAKLSKKRKRKQRVRSRSKEKRATFVEEHLHNLAEPEKKQEEKAEKLITGPSRARQCLIME
jgi:hypothetical protein